MGNSEHRSPARRSRLSQAAAPTLIAYRITCSPTFVTVTVSPFHPQSETPSHCYATVTHCRAVRDTHGSLASDQQWLARSVISNTPIYAEQVRIIDCEPKDAYNSTAAPFSTVRSIPFLSWSRNLGAGVLRMWMYPHMSRTERLSLLSPPRRSLFGGFYLAPAACDLAHLPHTPHEFVACGDRSGRACYSCFVYTAGAFSAKTRIAVPGAFAVTGGPVGAI